MSNNLKTQAVEQTVEAIERMKAADQRVKMADHRTERAVEELEATRAMANKFQGANPFVNDQSVLELAARLSWCLQNGQQPGVIEVAGRILYRLIRIDAVQRE